VVLFQNNDSAGGDFSDEFRSGTQAANRTGTIDSAGDLVGNPVDGSTRSADKFIDHPR
jgi:hypothetical protein